MERTMREGSKKIEAAKWLVTLVGLIAWAIFVGLFFYFAPLVMVTWNDHHF